MCFFRYTFEELQTIAAKELEEELARMEERLLKAGYCQVLATKQVHNALGVRLKFRNVSLYDGKKTLQKLAPSILQKLITKEQASSCVFVEKEFSFSAELVPLVARNCKRLVIATDSNIEEFCSRMYNEYGLAVEEVPLGSEVDCQVGVVISGHCYLGRNTKILDLSGQRRQSWLSFMQVKPPMMPYDFEPLEVFEALD